MFISVQFEITFECIEDLPEDLEWKIIYVGSAESEEYDQVLDTVYVGPVPEGRHKFVFQVRNQLVVAPISDFVWIMDCMVVEIYPTLSYDFQANPPNPEKIPEADLVGVTVVLLTCSYRGAEFIRIGYYVSNDYTEPELKETNPSPPQWGKLQRNILATNPR